MTVGIAAPPVSLAGFTPGLAPKIDDLKERVDAVEATVTAPVAMASTPRATPKLDALNVRVTSLETWRNGLVIPAGVDLGPLTGRVTSVENRTTALEQRPTFTRKAAPTGTAGSPIPADLPTGLVSVVPTALGTTNVKVNQLATRLAAVEAKLYELRDKVKETGVHT